MLRLNGGDRRVPTLLFPDGSVLVEPSGAELAAKVDVRAA
jgi:mycoredoxin